MRALSILAIEIYKKMGHYLNLTERKEATKQYLLTEITQWGIRKLNQGEVLIFKPKEWYHQNNPNIIWFDFNKLNELEEWVSNQLKKDFKNYFNILEKNGYIICDDFMWFFYKDLDQNPMKAILECYNKYRKKLSVEFVNHQIIFKKIH